MTRRRIDNIHILHNFAASAGILPGTGRGLCRYKMIRVHNIPENFDAAAGLPEILARLPHWRLQKALSYRRPIDTFLCAESFLILEGMLEESFGLDRCPEFSFGIHGKPFLREFPDIYFNISHCRRGIACAVLDRPVGIDIEEIQHGGELMDVVLNPEEVAMVTGHGEPDVKFTELWTLKESLLKLSGEGIRDDMKDILADTEGVSFTTRVSRSAGYVLSTAVNSAVQEA